MRPESSPVTATDLRVGKFGRTTALIALDLFVLPVRTPSSWTPSPARPQAMKPVIRCNGQARNAG